MKSVLNRNKILILFVLGAWFIVGLDARAVYETDSLPPGVAPRSAPDAITPTVAPSLTPEGSTPTPQPTQPPPPSSAPVMPVTTSPAARELILPDASATTADEKARFLTGRRLAAATRLGSLQNTPWYLDHARAFSASWRQFDQQYFSKMRSWSAQQILPRIGQVNHVFYLLGGPDFINAFALFPDAQTYILGGLEPIGSMVPPEKLDESRLMAGLDGLRQSTSVILQFSHFITKDMRTDLSATDFKGVVPVLLAFISLGGGEVLGVQSVGVDRNGDLQQVLSASDVAGLIPGVQFEFRKTPTAPVQTVFYFNTDVSNSAIQNNPALLAWMRRYAPGVSYLKASSYLLHESSFSIVRNFLLQESRAILQDDSGIPLNAFSLGSWQLTFFGSYTGTLDIFQKYVQADLAAAYQGGAPVLPLEFGTGYKWQVGESNLMLAVRTSAGRPAGDPSPAPIESQPTTR